MSQSTSEKFTIGCPQCGEIVTVTRAHVGKKGRCTVCHHVFVIQAPDGVVHRAAPTPQQKSQPDDVDPFAPVAQEQTPASASVASEYMKRAQEYKGPAIAQEENDATYRYMTSYGSVIGGIATIVLGSLLALVFLCGFGSIYLTVAMIFVIGGGIGWLVQGMNYITYYRWKDRGGRD